MDIDACRFLMAEPLGQRCRVAAGAFFPAIAFLVDNANRYPPALKFSGVQQQRRRFAPWTFCRMKTSRPLPALATGRHLRGRPMLFFLPVDRGFGNGAWDFRGVGSGLARSKVPLGHYERLQPHGDWRFPVEPTQVIESDGWLYHFGIMEFQKKRGITLVRVRPEKIEDPVEIEIKRRWQG